MPAKILAKFYTPSGSKCYTPKYLLKDFWLRSDLSRISKVLSSIANTNNKEITTIYPSRTSGLKGEDGKSINDSRYLSGLLARNGVWKLDISKTTGPQRIQKCLKELVKRDIREKDYFTNQSKKIFLGVSNDSRLGKIIPILANEDYMSISRDSFIGKLLTSNSLIDYRTLYFQSPLLSIKFDSETALIDGDLYRSILKTYKMKREALEYGDSTAAKTVKYWIKRGLVYGTPLIFATGLLDPDIRDFVMDYFGPIQYFMITIFSVFVGRKLDALTRGLRKTRIKSFLEILEESLQPTFLDKVGGIENYVPALSPKKNDISDKLPNIKLLKNAIDYSGDDNTTKLHTILPDKVQFLLTLKSFIKNKNDSWEKGKKAFPEDLLYLYGMLKKE